MLVTEEINLSVFRKISDNFYTRSISHKRTDKILNSSVIKAEDRTTLVRRKRKQNKTEKQPENMTKY